MNQESRIGSAVALVKEAAEKGNSRNRENMSVIERRGAEDEREGKPGARLGESMAQAAGAGALAGGGLGGFIGTRPEGKAINVPQPPIGGMRMPDKPTFVQVRPSAKSIARHVAGGAAAGAASLGLIGAGSYYAGQQAERNSK